MRATVRAALRPWSRLPPPALARACSMRVAGDHAEGAGDAGFQLHVLDAAGRLGADEVVVVGLAADDDAQAGDAGNVAGADQRLRRHRQLVGAGHRDPVTRSAR